MNSHSRVRGALRLEANLDELSIGGRIDDITVQQPGSSEYAALGQGNSIDIASAPIEEGRFTAQWVGSDTDEDSPARETVRGFGGTMLGEFYGPIAEEVGGVLSGQRDATDTTPRQYFMGGFGARNAEYAIAQGLADAVDLVANDSRQDDDGEYIGGWWWRVERGAPNAVVIGTHRDGGNINVIVAHDEDGQLQHNVSILPNVPLREADPWISAGQYINTFESPEEVEGATRSTRPISDHGLGSEWQVTELISD